MPHGRSGILYEGHCGFTWMLVLEVPYSLRAMCEFVVLRMLGMLLARPGGVVALCFFSARPSIPSVGA